MTDPKSLQVLRAMDKADRLSPPGVFALLTDGRRDSSGDFTPGCSMAKSRAAILTGFVFSLKQPQIADRFQMIAVLEDAATDVAGRTAWDIVLDLYADLPEPKNIAWVVDDLITACRDNAERSEPAAPAATVGG